MKTNTKKLMAVLTVTIVATFAANIALAEEPTLRELTAASREKAAQESKNKLRHILSKQKGDQLKVFLKDSQSIHINGLPVNSKELATIASESGLEKAQVTANVTVLPKRIAEVTKLITSSGIEDVESGEQLTLDEIAAASRAKAQRDREEKLRQVLARQKGDHLKVHLRDSLGISVNGTSVSLSELLTVIDKSGLQQAVLSAELEVTPARITEVEDLIKENGIKSIDSRAAKLTLREVAVASREQAARKHQANLRDILAHQRGDVLQVYVRNDVALFVNSRQISPKTLAEVVTESGLEKAVISADKRVTQKRLDEIEKVLKQNGATEVSVSILK